MEAVIIAGGSSFNSVNLLVAVVNGKLQALYQRAAVLFVGEIKDHRSVTVITYKPSEIIIVIKFIRIEVQVILITARTDADAEAMLITSVFLSEHVIASVLEIGVFAILAAVLTGSEDSKAIGTGGAVHYELIVVIMLAVRVGSLGSVNLLAVYKVDVDDRMLVLAILILFAFMGESYPLRAAPLAFVYRCAILVLTLELPPALVMGF